MGKKKVKFALYPILLMLIFLLFQCSNGSNLIRQSCQEASKGDPNLSYNFCVACLEANPKSRPTRIEELVDVSIRITKSNTTNIISNISEFLRNQNLSQYAKACLRDCFDLYSDALSELQDAVYAFNSGDLDTANIKVSAALDASVTCEDQFKEKKGETSPLTKDNNIYCQLSAISLAFIQMCHQNS
ncbi:hypothetical protein L6164_019712 [Bauhinia variegata]|uniref:Uncharacterized protein n=1 Tax=Bauhinia variegata TaxID=167791 RepID=A0ACB9MT13_BAUVA|nr:hypothetical protein L6164_019712 [Bauhinia variegata]